MSRVIFFVLALVAFLSAVIAVPTTDLSLDTSIMIDASPSPDVLPDVLVPSPSPIVRDVFMQ